MCSERAAVAAGSPTRSSSIKRRSSRTTTPSEANDQSCWSASLGSSIDARPASYRSRSTRRSSWRATVVPPGTTRAASPRSMKPTSPPCSIPHRRRSSAGRLVWPRWETRAFVVASSGALYRVPDTRRPRSTRARETCRPGEGTSNRQGAPGAPRTVALLRQTASMRGSGSWASSAIRASPRSAWSARRAAAACTAGSPRWGGSMRAGFRAQLFAQAAMSGSAP